MSVFFLRRVLLILKNIRDLNQYFRKSLSNYVYPFGSIPNSREILMQKRKEQVTPLPVNKNNTKSQLLSCIDPGGIRITEPLHQWLIRSIIRITYLCNIMLPWMALGMPFFSVNNQWYLILFCLKHIDCGCSLEPPMHYTSSIRDLYWKKIPGCTHLSFPFDRVASLENESILLNVQK